MGAFSDVTNALNSRLNTLVGDPIAWENKKHDPSANEGYLRPTVLPFDTEVSGLGDAGLDKHEGIYQVDVIYPPDKGRGSATKRADEIADHFKRGTVLTRNSIKVRITNVSIGVGSNDAAWYIVPVYINYQSHTTPR